MPIKRRAEIRELAPAPVEVRVEDLNLQMTEKEITYNRFMSFAVGCAGETLHPKKVNVSQLLQMVQVADNPPNTRDGRIEQFYRNRVRSPLTAIRAWCVMSMGGPKAANACTNATCPLWPFRTGKNSFYGKAKETEELNDDRDD